MLPSNSSEASGASASLRALSDVTSIDMDVLVTAAGLVVSGAVTESSVEDLESQLGITCEASHTVSSLDSLVSLVSLDSLDGSAGYPSHG